MKDTNKQIPMLKTNEGILKGGFKSLSIFQKLKVKAGERNVWFNPLCFNWFNC